jgi:hypothetical protein
MILLQEMHGHLDPTGSFCSINSVPVLEEYNPDPDYVGIVFGLKELI